MSMSDQAGQSAAALTDLFETHYDRVVRYITVRTGNWAQAEDLASEVFLRALERIGSFQWRGVPMQAWLFRIAHNLAVDYLRSQAAHKGAALEEAHSVAATDDPEAETLQTLQREELLHAMDSLTAAQREVVALRFFGGLKAVEVAQIVGRSPGAVRELQSSALKTLRRVMGPSRQKTLEAEQR